MKTIQIFAVLAATISILAAPLEERQAVNLEYEYIVIGSGAGGGPLASRLARAGHRTLLIEAGNDQQGNVNISVPGYQAVVTQDPKLRWDIFVNHYQDQERAKRDPKYSYETSPYQYHVGPDPPLGAKELGILYPRAGTLGGCVTHNALIWITPQARDWNYIRDLTGDNSWSAANMNQYLDRVYEWQPTQPTDPTILARDLKLTQHLAGGAAVQGFGPPPLSALTGLLGTLAVDPNSRINPLRDSTQGFFQIPLIMKDGVRTSVRDFIAATVAGGFPLTVRQNCHVTKIIFDTDESSNDVVDNSDSGCNDGDNVCNTKRQTTNSTLPRAIGVEFLDGEYLYRASPLSGGTGTRGWATATKEVIVSGGTFNTPQLLKLSGIGPAAELQKFNIPIIADLPGVGTNMQDRYEIPVNVKHPTTFPILDGCTFDNKPQDSCLTQWQTKPYILAQKGAYATDGLAATMAVNSATADNDDIDMFIFGGPVNFIGYFPQWGDFSVRDHTYFSWYTLKAHGRNRAGTVELRSADPLDTPVINFNYFDTGTTAGGADVKDLAAMVQAINMSRQALDNYYDYGILGGDGFVEERPGLEVASDEDLGQYIKDQAWGHHASSTAAIGADGDPMAVLDSRFRVRGVQGLRVVDASSFPIIPGIFIQAPIFMISEKAADVILNGS